VDNERAFVDEVVIKVKAGDGGDGVISFRREKFVPKGGPDGGDGGKGGDVILVGSSEINTLVDLYFQKEYRAGRGEHGKGKNMKGKDGEDIEIKVPLGTVVYDDETGELIAEILQEGQKVVVARGGKGGRGNARFKSAKHQAPRIAEYGEKGEEKILRLELKLLADVGLIGLPSVGKSSILRKVSAAKPKVAPWPFTTKRPILGMVKLGDFSYIVADIPGIIEGASAGKGKGIDFLKHIQRCAVWVYVLGYEYFEGSLVDEYETLKREVESFKERFDIDRPRNELIVVNKIDLPDVEEKFEREKGMLKKMGEVIAISALNGDNIEFLKRRLAEHVKSVKERREFKEKSIVVMQLKPVDRRWKIYRNENLIVIEGEDVETLVDRTVFNTQDSLDRFKEILKRWGIIDELIKMGVKEGDTIVIGGMEFEWTGM